MRRLLPSQRQSDEGDAYEEEGHLHDRVDGEQGEQERQDDGGDEPAHYVFRPASKSFNSASSRRS